MFPARRRARGLRPACKQALPACPVSPAFARHGPRRLWGADSRRRYSVIAFSNDELIAELRSMDDPETHAGSGTRPKSSPSELSKFAVTDIRSGSNNTSMLMTERFSVSEGEWPTARRTSMRVTDDIGALPVSPRDALDAKFVEDFASVEGHGSGRLQTVRLPSVQHRRRHHLPLQQLVRATGA